MARYDKLFTHPVLNSVNGDYKNSSFTIDLDPVNRSRKTYLTIDITLSNDELQQLIDSGKAAFLVKVECPYTCLRLPIVTDKTRIERTIECSKLSGDVSVTAYIVAKDSISNFRSADFNDDYTGVSFDLSKGDILAESDTKQFEAPKVSTNIEDSSPIITVQLNNGPDRDKKLAEVLLDGDIIAIRVCSEDFRNYNSLYKQPQMKNVIFSMLIVPALMTVFETLRAQGPQEYSDYQWFRTISKELENEIDMNEDKFDMRSYSSFTLAQLSLDKPIGSALRSLVRFNGTEEET